MVTVVSYEKRHAEDGREFFTLSIQGGVEIVKSSNGNLYMTARKTSIPSTFDEETCKMIIGQQLPGAIEKVNCEPYNYTNNQTGEILLLTHRFEYVAEKQDKTSANLMQGFMPFSMNDSEAKAFSISE